MLSLKSGLYLNLLHILFENNAQQPHVVHYYVLDSGTQVHCSHFLAELKVEKWLRYK